MVCGLNLAERMSVHSFSQILTDPDSCSVLKFQKIEEKVQHIQYVQYTTLDNGNKQLCGFRYLLFFNCYFRVNSFYG